MRPTGSWKFTWASLTETLITALSFPLTTGTSITLKIKFYKDVEISLTSLPNIYKCLLETQGMS